MVSVDYLQFQVVFVLLWQQGNSPEHLLQINLGLSDVLCIAERFLYVF